MTGGEAGESSGERFDDAQALRSLSDDRLRHVVATTWRASGWHVEVADSDDGVLITTRGDDGGSARERQLLHVLGDGHEPRAPTVRRAVELMRRFEAGGATVVSVSEFDDGAVSVADAYGVDLVGPAALARAVATTDDDRAD